MRNNRGNAIIIVLILIASVMATSAVVMQNSVSASQVYAQKSSSQTADNITQIFSTLMSNPNVCLNGVDGVGGAAGLQFLSGSGAPSVFSLAMAAGTGRQNVSLPSHYADSAGGYLRFQPGLLIPNSDIRVENLYVTGAVESPAGSGSYQMKLILQLRVEPTGGTARSLNVRQIMSLKIQTSSGVVTSCGATADSNSNEALCTGMNCTYTASSDGSPGNCFCPIQPVTCSGGNYVTNIVANIPQCSTSPFEISCSLGEFLVGLDASSNKICAQVTSCPAGTSVIGAGGPAVPAECRCNTGGFIWDIISSTCVPAPVPIAGDCGTADSTSRATAPSTPAELCDFGTATAVSGSGTPWTWDCIGISSGANVSCSATLSAAPVCVGGSSTTFTGPPASPAGCFCPTGQTWDSAFSSCVSGSGYTMWEMLALGVPASVNCTHTFTDTPSGAWTAPFDTGIPCTDLTEICLLNPSSSVGPPATAADLPCGFVTNTISPTICINLTFPKMRVCSRPLAAVGETINVPCSGAGPIFTGRGPNTCASGVQQCTSATTAICLAPLADGTVLPAGLCDPGVVPAPHCAGGAAICAIGFPSGFTQTCTTLIANGSTHTVSPGVCPGPPWQTFPAPAAADTACASGVGYCSAVDTKTCTAPLAAGTLIEHTQTLAELSDPTVSCFMAPFPKPAFPKSICASGLAACTAFTTFRCQ